MKKYYLSGLLLSLLIVSCTNELDEVIMSESASGYTSRSFANAEEKHPLIEGNYVELIDNKYVITISEEDALEKGISRESYQEFNSSVMEMNQMLEEIIDDCLSRGNKVIVESALYNDNSNNYISRVKSRAETGTESAEFPRGTITTNGQEYGLAGIEKIPYNMLFVNCNCYSNVAPLPSQVVVAESFGISKLVSGIGQSIDLKVGFDVTNVPGGIKYKTSDSNGGRCAWVGSSN